MATVRLGGLGKLKETIDLMWNRACDLPACSIVSEHELMEGYRTQQKAGGTIILHALQ
jgi:hypothetical protein